MKKSFSVDCRNHVLNEEVSGTLQAKKTGSYSLNYVNPIMQEIKQLNSDTPHLQDRIYSDEGIAPCCGVGNGHNSGIAAIQTKTLVRRLTPVEFARLQGFPDDHCKIQGATDANQHNAYGNSMTTNVMKWIGERIKAVDDLMTEL